MIIIKLLYFYLPIALANMAPVICKKWLLFLAKPIDNSLPWPGREIFGSHKTWRGLVVATIFGGIFFLAQFILAGRFPQFNNLPYDYLILPWWLGFALGFLAILGDLIKSFFKRRLNIKSGASWFPFDQIDFLILPSILISSYVSYEWYYWIFVISIGPIMHILINRVGFWLKLKPQPW